MKRIGPKFSGLASAKFERSERFPQLNGVESEQRLALVNAVVENRQTGEKRVALVLDLAQIRLFAFRCVVHFLETDLHFVHDAPYLLQAELEVLF